MLSTDVHECLAEIVSLIVDIAVEIVKCAKKISTNELIELTRHLHFLI